ncbi:hypothetical protein [Anaerorhabdus sp.]|uniref:hypothetical protein n=1 Tax=Anaerorhabdus sp. TaxID=1872524 RepID=UPI002FCC00FA
MTTSRKKIIVSGRNIYQDEKGRNILYNKNSGVGYLIQEKDEKNYNMYKNRYIFVIVGVILATNFLANVWICLAFGLIALAILEYRYRKVFIPTLVQITNFKPYENLTYIDQIVKNAEPNKILLSGILYVAFAILLVINGIEMKLSTALMIGNIVIACGSIVFAGIHFIAFARMKKAK